MQIFSVEGCGKRRERCCDADRLTAVTDPANNVTQYGYDTETNLTSITDADQFGNVKKQIAVPRTAQQTQSLVATGDDEMRVSRAIVKAQPIWAWRRYNIEREYMAVTDEPLEFDAGGKVAAEKDLAIDSRNAHASKTAKRGAASW